MLSALSFALLLSSATQSTNDPFRVRNGAMEAEHDLKDGKPLSLYWVHIGGSRTLQDWLPGIAGCPVSRYMIGLPVKFLEIPDADWSFSIQYSTKEMELQKSAFGFAADYNQMIYKMKLSEIRLFCPSATLDR